MVILHISSVGGYQNHHVGHISVEEHMENIEMYFFLLGNIKFLKEQILYITLVRESWERKQYHSEMHESFASIDDDQTSSEMEIIPD